MNSKKPKREIKTKGVCARDSNSWSCRYRRQAAFYVNRVTAPLKSCHSEGGREKVRERERATQVVNGNNFNWQLLSLCAKSADPLGWVSMPWYRCTPSDTLHHLLPSHAPVVYPKITPYQYHSTGKHINLCVVASKFQLLIAGLLLWPHGRRDVTQAR